MISRLKLITLLTPIFTPLTRQQWLMLALVGFTLLTPIAAASFGAANISFLDVFNVFIDKFSQLFMGENAPSTAAMTDRIVMELRLPRILLAFVAGAGLSLAGSVLQTVTRNPLADPYLFGISSGASFGAVVMLTLFSGSGFFANAGVIANSGIFSGAEILAGLQWFSLPFGAFIGASLSVLIVLALSGLGLNSQVERMLLSGVATSFMFGALTSLLLYFASPQATASVLFWSLGSFAKASWSLLILPTIVVLVSFFIILGWKRQIMALQAGDETAHTLGVNVPKLRLNMLLLCSLITAILVATCGGIGFVGLMIPHTVRLLFPGRQPILLTALVGGLFMVWIDVLARCLLGNQELPVGIITASIGSFFFLLILRRRKVAS
ncbi:iron ABC transporter permease [Shewanella oneidensis MR-1]|uniref:ABC-type cobalamin uptake system permease component BtuC n=1 Tax=Shewanella oneidensis (strain ATCC 700550 / JCM 31522 / CIP 106686 / LMG 19005 / NCIMB 14063 / MR-1) TaxID=211586 RepID=Q8EI19_SHEON|nr:iron ABC transporter permease [Shewanella oneidensis]AAN54107.1 ABC-type cobalamin uptake system permease component BtuC [Shewanella oneidensis MR-1]MDX5997088.1 iron ABC transporter permease [Shewanella oneidensis]MEE2028015.1 Hemin transport system permease protein HmuU [Shewanella oneidensis]QKG95855.1 iron ABC transporter permease [Shewanella oneidensis MR-1]